jgi:hypothetical protein
MVPSMPLHTRIQQTKRYVTRNEMKMAFQITNSYDRRYKVEISPELSGVLLDADGKSSLGDLMKDHGIEGDQKSLVDEMVSLWTKRVVSLRPPERS